LSRSVESSASHISAASQSSTTPRDSEAGHVVLDEFERDWAEKWLHGLITRGEGWLAEVEPEEDQDDDELELEQGRTAEMDESTEAEWAAYTAREKVLMDASALISSLAGCAGESRHAHGVALRWVSTVKLNIEQFSGRRYHPGSGLSPQSLSI
jgi:hypothetical protein